MELFVRYCAETGRFNTLKCIWNLSKNSTAARVFPFGQRCRFCLCYCRVTGQSLLSDQAHQAGQTQRQCRDIGNSQQGQPQCDKVRDQLGSDLPKRHAAASCAFVCVVTEPFEFGFMFLCFPLYVVYAALYGIFTIITYYSGFRAGFCFSAGATDLVFSASLPAAAKTWMIIPLGIAAFLVFYFVFYFAITKFDLKTPGREDDDVEESEKNIKLSNNNYTAIATGVLAAVGGKENITGADYCATRLRLEVKDSSAVNEKAVKAAGAAGVIRPSKTSCQVVIGPQVQFVFDELKKML